MCNLSVRINSKSKILTILDWVGGCQWLSQQYKTNLGNTIYYILYIKNYILYTICYILYTKYYNYNYNDITIPFTSKLYKVLI